MLGRPGMMETRHLLVTLAGDDRDLFHQTRSLHYQCQTRLKMNLVMAAFASKSSWGL